MTPHDDTHSRRPAARLAETRADLIARLSGLPGPARIEMARREAEATGGAIIAPSLPWGPQEHEITLLGLMASGPTEHAAVEEWIKAARRSADAVAA